MNIRQSFFDSFKELQKFYDLHKDHIQLVNVQLSVTGRYIIFYIAE